MYTEKMCPLGMLLGTVFIGSIDIVGRGPGMPSARHGGVFAPGGIAKRVRLILICPRSSKLIHRPAAQRVYGIGL